MYNHILSLILQLNNFTWLNTAYNGAISDLIHKLVKEYKYSSAKDQ